MSLLVNFDSTTGFCHAVRANSRIDLSSSVNDILVEVECIYEREDRTEEFFYVNGLYVCNDEQYEVNGMHF